MGDKQYSKTARTYWKSKTLLVPSKITKRSYQIKHIKCYPTTTTFQYCYSLKMKDDQELFLYNDADRNTRNTYFWLSFFTSEEIVKGTTLLKSRKASGHDSIISNEMIKGSLLSSLSFLVILFNKILQTQIYPEEWSRGIITPVPKSREIENPDNYLGITINSCLSKLFNLLLNSRLLCFINEKNILKNNQIGFCKSFLIFQFLTIRSMDKYLSENKKLYFCFVDFRKAYDSIWCETLFKKLLGYGYSTNFVSLLRNMYKKPSWVYAYLEV